MKKITISAFAFMAGTSVGVWLMLGGGFIGSSEVSSNGDFICRTQNLGTSTSKCTGGSWTAWDLENHIQIYQGFIYTTRTTKNWYSNTSGPGHFWRTYSCGSRGIKTESTATAVPCTMTRVDPGAPVIKTSTENISATCENC